MSKQTTTKARATLGSDPAKTANAIARLRAGVKAEGKTGKPGPIASDAPKAEAPKAAKPKRLPKVDENGDRWVTIKGVRHRVTHYQKATTALGNSTLDSGDALAVALRGVELDEVYARASKALGVPEAELRAKYSKLNPGMQRMNLGNRMRNAAHRAQAKAA